MIRVIPLETPGLGNRSYLATDGEIGVVVDPPRDVDRVLALLDRHGKDFTPVVYDDAGHAFFSVDRPSYRVAAANDGWERVEAFFGRHLAA